MLLRDREVLPDAAPVPGGGVEPAWPHSSNTDTNTNTNTNTNINTNPNPNTNRGSLEASNCLQTHLGCPSRLKLLVQCGLIRSMCFSLCQGSPHIATLRPVHLLRVSLLRVLESNFPGDPLTDMRIPTL